ncbi:MAG: DUF3467 domain-containing protein [Planctomycetes bacterium]|nr:DUF3467 domain-containing protein [Planctomycetota bacterium]
MSSELNPEPKKEPETITQEVKYSQVSARVTDKVSSGVFSSGALLLNGQNEFILDFLQRMVQPQRVVARVVMSPPSLLSFCNALEENLSMYQAKFGAPPQLPPPPPGSVPLPIEELYAQLKIADEMLEGSYSNAVMISHSPSDFVFDFIATFYPRSVVSARVFMSSSQIPPFLNTLKKGFQQFKDKIILPPAHGQNPSPPPA